MLQQSDIKKILDFVKKEPRTVQDVSKLIKRSWVTTDTYLQRMKNDTGLIDIKTFRKGSQAALKIVFYNYTDTLITDDVKEMIYDQIKSARTKKDFDFMNIFQYVQSNKKKAFIEEYDDEDISKNQKIISFFRQAKQSVQIFSGNLSFINIKEDKISMISLLEELVKRKITVKILCRVNIASISNINKLSKLLTNYSDFIEIRHCYQPLRGFIIDDSITRFKDEEYLQIYKKGELNKNTRIFYEIYDKEWILWLQKVFWNLFRVSLDYKIRLKEIKELI